MVGWVLALTQNWDCAETRGCKHPPYNSTNTRHMSTGVDTMMIRILSTVLLLFVAIIPVQHRRRGGRRLHSFSATAGISTAGSAGRTSPGWLRTE